jgi:hypothetical protein
MAKWLKGYLEIKVLGIVEINALANKRVKVGVEIGWLWIYA